MVDDQNPETSVTGHRPGSEGEHEVQRRLGSTSRADRFYDAQMLDHLNANMREFVGEQEMFFLATSDAKGECDNTFRAGPRGFLRVLDEKTLVFPEYRGNGVHASLGNIEENPHLGILLVDFFRARIGLHINGDARIVADADLRETHPDLPVETVPGRRAELWVEVTVEEAYIHCAKHIPQLQKAPKGTPRDWGTDDPGRKGGDYFGAARDRAQETAGTAGPRGGRTRPGRRTPEPAGTGTGTADHAGTPAGDRTAPPVPSQPPVLPPRPAAAPPMPTTAPATTVPPAPTTPPVPAAQAAPAAPNLPPTVGAHSTEPPPPHQPPPPHEPAAGLVPPQPVREWQQQARRVLAEAEARGRARDDDARRTPVATERDVEPAENAAFRGWFARTAG